jgi:hypothetical protein
MVCYYTAWNFNLSPRRKVARRGLEKEERLFRPGVVELLDVLRVIPANGNDLGSKSEYVSRVAIFGFTFFPCLTN